MSEFCGKTVLFLRRVWKSDVRKWEPSIFSKIINFAQKHFALKSAGIKVRGKALICFYATLAPTTLISYFHLQLAIREQGAANILMHLSSKSVEPLTYLWLTLACETNH